MASLESAVHLWRAREILKPKSVQLYLVFNSKAAQVAFLSRDAEPVTFCNVAIHQFRR